MRTWLESHDHWLLFDNVVEPRTIRSYLPRNGAGHVLISRHQSWHELARSVDDRPRAGRRPSAAPCSTGRQRRRGRQRAELASLLGRLPLALEEAAARTCTTGRTLREYASLFPATRGALLASSTVRRTTRRRCDHVAMSLQQPVRAEGLAVVDLLAFLAHLAPDACRAFFLPPRAGSADASPARDETALDRQLAALLRYSLVRVGGRQIFVHRLLQAVVRPSVRGAPALAGPDAAPVERAFPKSGSAGRARPGVHRLILRAVAAFRPRA